MGHLSSCYFCGVAIITPLENYRLPDADGKTVTLCSTCRHKLATVLESNGVAGPESLPEEADAVPAEAGGSDDGASVAPAQDAEPVGTVEDEDELDGTDEGEDTDTETGGPEPVAEEDGSDETGGIATTAVVDTETGGTADDDLDLSEPEAAGPPADASAPEEADAPDDPENGEPPETDADEPTEGIDPSIIQADEIATGKAEIEDVLGEAVTPETGKDTEAGEETGQIPGDSASDGVEPDEGGGEPESPVGDVETGDGDTEEDPLGDEDPFVREGDTDEGAPADEEPFGEEGPPANEDSLGDEETIAEENGLGDEGVAEDAEDGSLDTNLAELRDSPPGESEGSSPPSTETTTQEESGSETAGRESAEDEGGFTFDQGEKEGGIDKDLKEQMEPDIPEEFGTDPPEVDEPEGHEPEVGEPDVNEPDVGEPEETAETGREGGDEEPSDDSGHSPETSISALEYNKVMRLLQNREFPVNRLWVETVASNAYDLSEAECAEVIDIAIDRGLLAEENGELLKPE